MSEKEYVGVLRSVSSNEIHMSLVPRSQTMSETNTPSPTDEEAFRRTGETLMEFPQMIKSLSKVDGRLFVTLADGQVIDVTELLGNAKH